MDDSNPWLGVAGAIFFLALGLVYFLSPRKIQQRVQAVHSQKRWHRHLPFSTFVDSPSYVPTLRFIGGFFFLVGLLLLVASLFALSNR